MGADEKEAPSKKERQRKRDRRRRIRVQKIREDVEAAETTGILTWSMQKMSMNANNRRKLRRFAFYCLRKQYNIVLMSAIMAEEPGVIWLG